RSAQRWESKPRTPPIEPAVQLIYDTYNTVLREAELIVDAALKEPGPVRLYRYLNQPHFDQHNRHGDVEIHNAVVRVAFQRLFDQGQTVEVHIPEYEARNSRSRRA